MPRHATADLRQAPAPVRGSPVAALLPLYVVVFAGFVGYSLMITVFTPMLLRADTGLLPATASKSTRTIVLGVLLCLYQRKVRTNHLV